MVLNCRTEPISWPANCQITSKSRLELSVFLLDSEYTTWSWLKPIALTSNELVALIGDMQSLQRLCEVKAVVTCELKKVLQEV